MRQVTIKGKVMLVGVMPPSLGGMSTHIERLADKLYDKGWEVVVFDLYSPITAVLTKPYEVIRGRNLKMLFRIFQEAGIRRGNLVHVHLAAAASLPAMLPVLLALRIFSNVILTIHSGNAPLKLAKLSLLRKWATQAAFKSATRIICVNEEISAFLTRWIPGIEPRLRVATPFITPLSALAKRHSTESQQPVFLAAGSDHPLYEWLTLVEALEGVAGVGTVHCAFYNRSHPDVYEKVLDLCQRSSHRYVIHDNLTSDQFVELMATVDCFIRPTLTDGDSMAVREALSSGIKVIASNSVARPPGCKLFHVGSVPALREAIVAVMEEGFDQNALPAPCGAQALEGIYQEII